MADNFAAQAVTSAGSTFASQEIGGVQYSIGKLSFGSTNVTTVASTDAGVPVQMALNGLIAGSSLAGLQGGAGAVTAGTGRMTLASDDPAVTALQIIDDWDESDRAKVNIVAGQAGITAGAGAVSTNTPRVTLASDDPAVAALQTIDNWSESSRAKVNPIAGQAGVAAGSGTVSALTQRVVLATDVALPAGTNNIGDVDVATLIPGTSANQLGKLTGAAAITGDVGVALLARREDTATAVVATTGTYAPLEVDSAGRLHVNAGTVTVASHEVTNAGTFAVQAAQSGSWTAAITAVTPGSSANQLGKQTGTAATTDDIGVAILARRHDTASAVAATTGNYAPLEVDASGKLHVNPGTVDVTNTGTFAVQAAQSGTWNVGTVTGGAVAHDSTDAGNPLKIGTVATSSDRTAVVHMDRVDLVADVRGKLITRPHCSEGMQVDGNATATTTDHTSLIAAQGAAATINVTNASFANSSTTPTICIIASSTTIKWYTIAPGQSGSNIKFDPPLRMAANAACQFRVLTAVSTVYAAVSGYVSST